MFALLLTVLAAHAETGDAIANVIFINNWDGVPTITLIGGLDEATGVWNHIYTLNDGDAVRDGDDWRYNVPEGLVAPYDELVVSPNTREVKVLTLFDHAQVVTAVKRTEFDMSESRHFPNTSGRGGSFYVSFTNIMSCKGTACGYPKLLTLPRLRPSP